ncbi:M20/M25/M40 family metallo-hydrolase [Arenivirga flava]|nr:M20/M25/M40 family metallo-hydrolase [Arenivirga flava]
MNEQLDETAIIARDLIRFDTTNYGEGRSKGETEAAEYVGAKLEALGLAPTYIDAEPGRTSVLARVPGRTGSERGALVVHGHLDVVPAVAEDWSVDPFGGEIRDGMLWGRGAVDMKNMDAMILTALGDVLEHGGPERDLIVAFFSDEEAGGVRGSHHVVEHHPELFAGATEAISEVGGYSITVGGERAYLLQTGEKSLRWLTLTAHGAASHGSQVVRDNAVTRLAEAIVAIGREEWPVRLTGTTSALLGEIARILGVDPERTGPDELAFATGTANRFIASSLRTTSNPTRLEAGYKHNVIPGTAQAFVDVRTLPGEEDQVMARLRELVGDGIDIAVSHGDTGLEVPFEGPLVEAMVAAIGAHDPGAPVLPYLLGAGTDNKALSLLGIAGYGFAPLRLPADFDFPSLFHGVDERVPLDALVFGRRVLRDLLARY